MRETNYHKVSGKTNEDFRRRVHVFQMQKRMILFIGIVIVSIVILLFSSIRTFASSNADEDFYKYYTSIRVQKGDTLWDIADQYVIDGIMSKEDFINEAKELNGLSSDGQIHSGEYIIIAYYSTEYMP